MKEKEIAQRIMALYHLQRTPEEKKQFIDLLKSIITIIETINRDDFEKFVEDLEKHLDELNEIEKEHGIRKSKDMV
jgi:Asp-tRNA(Asn)/Glu-tRNA(Gln) amidotransferase C subunit